MGASVARHSLRPLLIPRVKFLTNSGAMSRENANACSPSFQSATRTSDAELRIGEFRDSGFAEPVIGPRFARTRWRPGMTVQIKRRLETTNSMKVVIWHRHFSPPPA